MEYLHLTSGYEIPKLGVGVFTLTDYGVCKETVLNALGAGYRHIDTARMYGNENAVGDALAESGMARAEVFLTTKLWVSDYDEKKAREAVKRSLQRLRTDYIDLVLLHRPFAGDKRAWKVLESCVKEGAIRSIGVSNYDEKQLEELLSETEIKPVVNQIECHPYFQRREFRRFMAERGIATEAWYPLGHGDKKLLCDPVITDIAAKYGKSSGQVILRWHLQENNVVFPRAVNPAHLAQNYDIFDFELSSAEMERIRAMDKNKPYYNVPSWFEKIMYRMMKAK